MEKSIRVHILGREYPLRVREEDEELTRKVAALVSERMRTTRTDLPNQPDLTVAIITALSLAEENFTLQQAAGEAGALDVELNKMIERLDSALQPENAEV